MIEMFPNELYTVSYITGQLAVKRKFHGGIYIPVFDDRNTAYLMTKLEMQGIPTPLIFIGDGKIKDIRVSEVEIADLMGKKEQLKKAGFIGIALFDDEEITHLEYHEIIPLGYQNPLEN